MGSGLVEKYNVSLKKLLQQEISEPELHGDLVYGIRKIVGKSNFSEQFRKLINRYKRISLVEEGAGLRAFPAFVCLFCTC